MLLGILGQHFRRIVFRFDRNRDQPQRIALGMLLERPLQLDELRGLLRTRLLATGENEGGHPDLAAQLLAGKRLARLVDQMKPRKRTEDTDLRRTHGPKCIVIRMTRYGRSARRRGGRRRLRRRLRLSPATGPRRDAQQSKSDSGGRESDGGRASDHEMALDGSGNGPLHMVQVSGTDGKRVRQRAASDARVFVALSQIRNRGGRLARLWRGSGE